MAQTLKRKFPVLILCTALLLSLCGCQKGKTSLTFPFDSNDATYLETLYGKSLGDMAEEWDFSIEDLVEKPEGSGAWSLDRTVTIEGKEFTQTLMMSPDLFCGLEYRYDCDSAEEAAKLAETIYSDILEEYEAPAYEPLSSPNLLANEGVFDEMKTAQRGNWYEAWGRIGEISWLRMDVDIWVKEDKGLFSIRLTYRVVPEEWHRFEPGYQAPFPLFPVEEEQ